MGLVRDFRKRERDSVLAHLVLGAVFGLGLELQVRVRERVMGLGG